MVKVFSLSLACRLSVNLSVGLIDVASASDYDPLYCSWTIGKVGITNAVALFIVQRINLGSCRYLLPFALFVLLLRIWKEHRIDHQCTVMYLLFYVKSIRTLA